jgi:Uncharacterised protein family (UPF0182)
LDRFLLLYDDNSIVVGAGYTDVHVELPVLWLLISVATVAAVVVRGVQPPEDHGETIPRGAGSEFPVAAG